MNKRLLARVLGTDNDESSVEQWLSDHDYNDGDEDSSDDSDVEE